ncbi:hypothetical protein L226DRAFT_173885 [Lentinus tigrinus ALCF2SS1-7]|nr:hypothetical protein L226DRAFT_173885 [Lentinus tigrinus ALCF2SS1-7]
MGAHQIRDAISRCHLNSLRNRDRDSGLPVSRDPPSCRPALCVACGDRPRTCARIDCRASARAGQISSRPRVLVRDPQGGRLGCGAVLVVIPAVAMFRKPWMPVMRPRSLSSPTVLLS